MSYGRGVNQPAAFDPARRDAVEAMVELSAAPRSVTELVEALGVSQPLVSQHLRVLRSARLVAVDRRHRERVYRLLDDHVRHIVGDAGQHVAEHGR